jgi:hypothetical protein
MQGANCVSLSTLAVDSSTLTLNLAKSQRGDTLPPLFLAPGNKLEIWLLPSCRSNVPVLLYILLNIISRFKKSATYIGKKIQDNAAFKLELKNPSFSIGMEAKMLTELLRLIIHICL